jgi:hypothetical protein
MEDLGDVSEFETPPTNVERFLAQNPDYGNRVAAALEESCKAKGKEVGILIQTKLDKIGHDLSDRYGDMIMGSVTRALQSNLPANVDRSDIEILEEDDCDMEATFDVMRAFWEGMKPYVVSAVAALSEGLDWGFPFSVAEAVREEFPAFPLTPEEPVDERLQ